MSADRLWIVTGATGFVGGTVVRELLKRGENVRALGRTRAHMQALRDVNCDKRLRDLAERGSLAEEFRAEPGVAVYVVHCAGLVSIDSGATDELQRANVVATQAVLEACRATSVQRLVYVSSVHALPPAVGGAVIREPNSLAEINAHAVDPGYGSTKAEATRIVLEATDLDRVVVMPTGILGPGDVRGGFMATLIGKLASDSMPAIIAGGFDFVDVRDVAAGVIAAVQRGRSGECYLLSGEYASIARISRIVSGVTGSKPPRMVSLRLAKMIAIGAEAWSKVFKTRPLFTRYSLATLGSNGEVSSAKARNELGYNTRPLADSVRDEIAWWRQQQSESDVDPT